MRLYAPQIQRYLAKISGPLLDRIGLPVDVPEVKYRELMRERDGEPSAVIAKRVAKSRELQLRRFRKSSIFCNAQMGSAQIRQYCVLDEDTRKLLEAAIQRLNFSARANDRILKVARTIADLAGSKDVRSEQCLGGHPVSFARPQLLWTPFKNKTSISMFAPRDLFGNPKHS